MHLCAGQLEAFVQLIPGNPVLTIYVELKHWGGFVPAIHINSLLTQWPWSCKDLSVLLNSSTWIILDGASHWSCFSLKLSQGFCKIRFLQIKLSSVMPCQKFKIIFGDHKRNMIMVFNHTYSPHKASGCLFIGQSSALWKVLWTTVWLLGLHIWSLKVKNPPWFYPVTFWSLALTVPVCAINSHFCQCLLRLLLLQQECLQARKIWLVFWSRIFVVFGLDD